MRLIYDSPVRVLSRIAGLALLTLATACGSKPLDPALPESWIQPNRPAAFWSLWTDVRAYLGEERWAELDTSWMAERAAADVPRADKAYADELIYSGLWRMNMERPAVLSALTRLEPDVSWPLEPLGWREPNAWRPRLERWYQAQPEAEAESLMRQKLDADWKLAYSSRDLGLAARVVEARETWLGEAPTAKTASEALLLVQESVTSENLDRIYGDGIVPPGFVELTERFGIPSGIKIDRIARAVARRAEDLENATIPIPRLYDLQLQALRLGRL